MKIMVLAHALRTAGGRATAMNLLHALRSVDSSNDYLILVPDQREYRSLNLESDRFSIVYYKRRFGHLGRWFFDRFTLRRIARQFRPEVIWGPGNLGFFNPPCPQAISIQNAYLLYDVHHLGRLTLVDRMWLRALRRAFLKSLHRSQLVFCQTKTIEERLRSVCGYQGLTAVTSKVISTFSASGDGAAPKALGALAGKFKIFYLARYYPHKGLEMLVDVMDRYRDVLSDAVAIITIEPSQHPNAARLLRYIEARGLTRHIVNVGPLAQDELAGYYRASDCLLMPTRLESFSGTYLEAMHFGLPILTSDLDFAHEVCGDAALYFDPWNPESIKDAILKVKDNPALREELAARGRARLVEAFDGTWEGIARRILEGLASIADADRTTPRVKQEDKAS